MGIWTADVRAVLFDLDGTLIDSTAAVARSWGAWAERWGLGGRFTGYRHGVPARRVIADVVPPERVDEALADIEAIEVADVAGIRALPGAAALLAALPHERWAIVTSGTAPLARARITETGLDPLVVVSASDTERGKPSPDPYLAAARLLGVDPADCLVVEDAPAGVEAGRAAGCRVLAVTGTVPAVELAGADAIAASVADVTAVAADDRLRIAVRTLG